MTFVPISDRVMKSELKTVKMLKTKKATSATVNQVSMVILVQVGSAENPEADL